MSAYRANVVALVPEKRLPPYSFGRWRCPKCRALRLFSFRSSSAFTVGVWSNKLAGLVRECGRCEFAWTVRGRDES